MNNSGTLEVRWLTDQLQEKLRASDLTDNVRSDIQTLLAVLQCPLFGTILSIEDSLAELRNQVSKHPSSHPPIDKTSSLSEDSRNFPSEHSQTSSSTIAHPAPGAGRHLAQDVAKYRAPQPPLPSSVGATGSSGVKSPHPQASKQTSLDLVANQDHSQRQPEQQRTKPPVKGGLSSGQMVLQTEFAQVESIDLVNDGGGLGFGIVGGKSTGVVVKTLVGGGVADRDGRMKVGDHILSIGDVSLRGMTSEQVAQVLRSQGSAVRLLLARPFDPQIADIIPPVDTGLSQTAIILTRLLTDLDEVHRLLAAAAVPEPLPIPPPGFGDDSPSVEVISPPEVVGPQPTKKPGTTSVLVTSSDTSVVSVLSTRNNQGKDVDLGRIIRPPEESASQKAGLIPSLSEELPEMETFDVQLVKDHQGLGITIAGYVCEKEEISGIFVKSIAKGSAADLSNMIAINDQIIEVDGQPLFGFTNHQAVEVLRKSGRIVNLRLARYLRGPKYEQLQQAIASTDLPTSNIHIQQSVHPLPPPKPVFIPPDYPVSTTIRVGGNEGDERKASLDVSSIPSDIDSSEMDLPPPPPSMALPSVPCPPSSPPSSSLSSSHNNYHNLNTVVKVNEMNNEDQKILGLVKEWSKRMGSDYDILVASIAKFHETGGLGISLEGTVDIENGEEVRPHHYIRGILPDGPVGKEGTLKKGDEILEVNGQELVDLDHKAVVALLKELPVHVEMICARRVVNNNRSSVLDNNTISVGTGDAESLAKGVKREASDTSPTILASLDRLVKAKSDGSLAAGIGSQVGLILTDDSSRIRSRSLEPLTGLAMWSSQPQLVELMKGERGLGFSILDYQDPMNPTETVIVVRSLVPGGVAQMDGRLIPGDRLISVNGVNLENASLDEAVQVLKGAPKGIVQIEVAKPLPLPESEGGGPRLPPDYFQFSSSTAGLGHRA